MTSLEDNFVQVVSNHTAGDPMQPDVVWTYLTAGEIARQVTELGTPICPDTARTLLDEFGFHKRSVEKMKTRAHVPGRNEQFEFIAELKREYLASPNPVISMDTKKKELIGDLYRPGRRYANGPNETLDHDYPSYAEGKLIPHGLYDLKRNAGHLTLGLSHDTSEFACDSLGFWWRRYGCRAYPNAYSMLLLCDAGGSNNCRHHIFKEDLQRLANRMGIPIRIAHYPTHCSKYNPIERKFFSHVTRAWSGVVFRTIDLVTRCLRRVTNVAGLTVTYAVSDKKYALKRQASNDFILNSTIDHSDLLPDWNYTAVPVRA